MGFDYELWKKRQKICVETVRRFYELDNKKNSVKCNSILCVMNNAMQDIQSYFDNHKKSAAELCFLIRNIDVVITGILDINNLLLGIGLNKQEKAIEKCFTNKEIICGFRTLRSQILAHPVDTHYINDRGKLEIVYMEDFRPFNPSKTGGENFSLFDPAVLDEISKMKEKNIAVEILKKLMAEQVSLYKRTNVVQSQKFSEKIAQLMNSYYNGLITNEEVIKELLETAEEIANLYKNGQKLGLSQEELAFYDALTKPEHIKDFYKNDELIALTKELTEMLRKNRTIDWQKKETARATMRKMVKRLLKKHDYPPEDYDFAINTVISQCELWTDNSDAPYMEKHDSTFRYSEEAKLANVAEEKSSYGDKK